LRVRGQQLGGHWLLVHATSGVQSTTIGVNASASEVQTALRTMFPTLGVQVTDADRQLEQRTWNVTFTTSVGELPQLTMNTDQVTGSSIAASVTVLRDAMRPVFSAANSVRVARQPDVQRIELSTSAADLDGAFFVEAHGQRSAPLSVHLDAAAFATELQTIDGVGKVQVERVERALAVGDIVFQRAGVDFLVTFVNSMQPQPLLLVATHRYARAAVTATGGTLLGSSARVRVERHEAGGLPMFVDLNVAPPLSNSSAPSQQWVSVRATAITSAGAAAYTYATHFSGLEAQSPSPPRDVTMLSVGPNQLHVSWLPPLSQGGHAVAQYWVQISTDTTFSPAHTSVHTVDATATTVTTLRGRVYSFVASGLDSMRTYHVRVIASNSIGHSSPAHARVDASD
ncbi:MAG: fibronectin type III domain-containing protein, partial [Methanobacteriota archaeon]